MGEGSRMGGISVAKCDYVWYRCVALLKQILKIIVLHVNNNLKYTLFVTIFTHNNNYVYIHMERHNWGEPEQAPH